MGLKRQDVDRLLAPDFVEGLTDAPFEELRVKRADCRRVEDLVSYLRRVIQGQVDLVVAEMEMRLVGGGSDHRHRLVEDLPSILTGRASTGGVREADHSAEAGARQTASLLAVPVVSEFFDEQAGLSPDEIAAVIAPEMAATTFKGGMLPGANLDMFADSELTELVERLRRQEALLSAERRILHERIDVLQAIVVERYKSGAAQADTLLNNQSVVEGEPGSSEPVGDAADGVSRDDSP
jgi:hypothetical protein